MLNLVFAYCFKLTADSCFILIFDCFSQTGSPWKFGQLAFREDNQSRARGSVSHGVPNFFRSWQGTGFVASAVEIRAMHMAGPAPSGDFWFLLVASKGTRRRQGNWGDVVFF